MANSILQDTSTFNGGGNFVKQTGTNQISLETPDGAAMLVLDNTAKTIAVASGVTLS